MTSAHSTRPTILYIAGWGRCGSTLLDMMLGQCAGVVSAGEVREIWLRGCRENRPCSCGHAFYDCPFWTEVGQAAFGGWEQLPLERLLRTRYRYDRPWGIPVLARRKVNQDVQEYLDVLTRLLRAVSDVGQARVVVDSSKIPSHGMVLRHAAASGELDIRTLHLVRDSRGVAYSLQKKVVKTTTSGEPTLLPQHGAVSSALRYDLYNGMSAELRRFLTPFRTQRYEDLVADPEGTLRSILEFSGLPAQTPLPFLHGDSVELATTHLVDGNPVRFSTGPLQVRPDVAWRSGLSERDQRIVNVLTAPLRHRYDYPAHP